MTNGWISKGWRVGLSIVAFWCCLLSWNGAAEAQYKHMALGATAGFLLTSNPGGIANAPKGTRTEAGYGIGPSFVTLGAHGGWRFEDNLGVYFETHISFHQCGVPNDVCDAGSTPIKLSVYTDFRIFFMTDSFRPYVNIGVGYWQTLGLQGPGKTGLSSFGPTAALGFEWFIPGVEEIALGLQIRYNLQLVVGPKGIEPFHGMHAVFAFTTYL